MKFFNRILFTALLAMAFFMSGCDKTKPYETTVPPAKAHFVGSSLQTYTIATDPAPVFNVEIGTTDVSGSDRVVGYNVTSPSGAVAGTHYTIGTSGTVTIPAGSAVANIDIHAIYSQYATGRKDTLLFTLTTPSVEIADFQDTLTVVLKGVPPGGCSEDGIDPAVLLGAYNNTNETFATDTYGPYPTAIASFDVTSPTTGTIVVENIFDDGWGPISFEVDWTDITNRTVVVIPQDAIPGSDAGGISTTYAGQTVAVDVPTVALSPTPGTYSYCDETFTLKMQLGVTALGFFNALYTVTMER